MKVILNNKIYLEKSKLSREVRTTIRKNYTFKNKNTFGDKIEFRGTTSETEIDGITYLMLPPNLSYFEKLMKDNFPEIKYEIIDERVCPKVEGFKSNITPRDNQIPILKELEKVGHNAIISARTGAGKTALSIYLTEKLQTTMLFTATRISLVQNLLKDCKQFGIDESQITEINAEWLKNPIITPIMFCTIQALSPEICQELYGKVGLLVCDEVHLGISGESNSESLFNINPKFRIYLSATYKNLNFDGLNECLLSSNIITAEEEINFEITVKPIKFIMDLDFVYNYGKVYTSHEKKEIMYSDWYLEQAVHLAYWKIKVEKRGVLIYVESQSAQEELAESLRMKCLRVGVLNAKTKKKDSEDIINKFDEGKYDVIVAGNSISAGVSLYRLSTIINLNITINENSLEQLVGRLKRQNDEVCDKPKEFYTFYVRGCSDMKWKNDRKCLNQFDYIKWQDEFEFDTKDKHFCKSLLEVIKDDLRLGLI